MPPRRASRTRLITGAAALAVTVAVAALPLRDPGVLDVIVQAMAAAAVLAAAIGVLGAFPAWGVVAAGLLGAELVATFHDRPPAIDGRTPLVAAGILVVAELVAWSAEARTAGTVAGTAAVPRPLVVAACGAGAYAAAATLVAVVGLPVGRDLAVRAVGAAAVIAVIGVLVGLARGRAGPLAGRG